VAAITKAFDRVENELLAVAKTAYKAGFPKTAYVGSCALIAVVVDDKLYVANCGDSKAVLLRAKGENMEAINVSKTFSASNKEEQDRLKKQFRYDKDVIVCQKDDPTICKVKDQISPSRSIGDFFMKFKEFNDPGFGETSQELGYREPIADFKGGYITHNPDV
jgi:serine/threonine protein phosphatase PrpC